MEEHAAIQLDKVIHQKARLGIMSILMVQESADFNYLKSRLKMSDGNLSTHISHLERSKYIRIQKKFGKKKPKTICRITEKGRKAIIKYINSLEQIIKSIPTD